MKKGTVLHLITEEGLDPVEARINWLIDHVYDVWMIEDDPFAEAALINLYAVRENWDWYMSPRFSKEHKE